MAGGAFRGGIHPPDHKDATSGSPIERAPLPDRLTVPMSQHLGAPCVPLVAKGDRVERGQLIGEIDALISAPVHAPASGEVVAIVSALTPAGIRATCVVIEPDAGQDRDAYIPIRPEHEGAGPSARAPGSSGWAVPRSRRP